MNEQEKIKLLNEIEQLKLRNSELEQKVAISEEKGTLLQRKVLSRALLNIPTDAVLLVDRNCTIIDVNETTARRFVTFVENLIGTSLLKLFSQNSSAKICEFIELVIDSKQPYRFEDEKLGVWSDVVFYPIFNVDQSIEHIAVVSRDITKLKEVERKLAQSNKKNKALLQVIPDPVVRCTRNGVVQDVQGPRLDFPIKLNEALIGKPIFSIIPAKYVHTLIFNIEKSLQTKKVQILEIKIEHSSQFRFIEIRVVSEKSTGFVVIFRNITDWKMIEEKLIHAKEQAEKADELKSNFLAQMSHEIRTPINSIVNFISILKSELYDGVGNELKLCFDSISNGGTRLIRTMDLILNMAQIQTGGYELIKSQLDVQQLLKGVIKAHSDIVFEKKLAVELECRIENTQIIADEYSVTQIFNNLIYNAINFTDKGKIKVRIFEERDKLLIEVEDTGIGISEEYLPSIFEPFTQEESGYTRKFDGNGLGLAIIKHFCEYNNAGISVSSRKGLGSIFTVSFEKNINVN